MNESQYATVQNSSSHAQQDDLILFVIEQLKTQVVNYTKINQDNKNVNEIFTAELERYKDQVRILKEQNNVDKASESCAQCLEIDNLKHTLSEHLKEKESLEQMTELSAEQAFWSQNSGNFEEPNLSTRVNLRTSASGSQPQGNTKKDRIQQPQSRAKKNKLEDHPRNVRPSLHNKKSVVNTKAILSVPNSKLNVNSDLKCAKCNGCLFSDNHDLCVLEFINSVNTRVKSKSAKKPVNRKIWKPTGKVVQIVLWYLDSGCSKHMTGDRSQLINFVQKFLDLEVAFRQHTCFIRNLDGVDLLTGSRGNNLYTLSLGDMMASSPICLLSKASKTKSWLWHRRLSHLNFGAINHLARQGLVRGLPKLKFEKDHLCSACAMGKSKKKSHKPKSKDTNKEKLYLLHMDLCGPMRVESKNRKNVIDLVPLTCVIFKHFIEIVIHSISLNHPCCGTLPSCEGFAAVLAILKLERLKADRARIYEEASKVESCPSEIILDDLLALDSIVRYDLGDRRLEQTATFSISKEPMIIPLLLPEDVSVLSETYSSYQDAGV
nr:retrovirus-related Pol polyprotein from transposon TNT 1-94 [Tanacetum cinerariifolium]